MHRLISCLVALVLMTPWRADAQVNASRSIELAESELRAEFDRAMADVLARGRAVADRNLAVEDLKEYSVAVAVVVRPAGERLSASLRHDRVTEIYYVVRGSGTHVTGKLADPIPTPASTIVGPSHSSGNPLIDAKATRLSAGDVQVIPAGVAHGFTSIDPGGIEYLVFRVDPDRSLTRSSPR